MTLQAADAATALQEGRSLAEDFFRVLGSSYTGYLLDPHDDRDHITRLDASYVADGRFRRRTSQKAASAKPG